MSPYTSLISTPVASGWFQSHCQPPPGAGFFSVQIGKTGSLNWAPFGLFRTRHTGAERAGQKSDAAGATILRIPELPRLADGLSGALGEFDRFGILAALGHRDHIIAILALGDHLGWLRRGGAQALGDLHFFKAANRLRLIVAMGEGIKLAAVQGADARIKMVHRCLLWSAARWPLQFHDHNANP